MHCGLLCGSPLLLYIGLEGCRKTSMSLAVGSRPDETTESIGVRRLNAYKKNQKLKQSYIWKIMTF